MNDLSQRGPLGPKAPKERFTAAEGRYYGWIADRCTCCLTGRLDFDRAHTGSLTEGKGMGRKSALRTVLPLSRPLHVVEEKQRKTFWVNAGVPDYLECAERLFDIFEANGDPRDLLADMQGKADRSFLAQYLREW